MKLPNSSVVGKMGISSWLLCTRIWIGGLKSVTGKFWQEFRLTQWEHVRITARPNMKRSEEFLSSRIGYSGRLNERGESQVTGPADWTVGGAPAASKTTIRRWNVAQGDQRCHKVSAPGLRGTI